MYEHALEVPYGYFFFKGFGGQLFVENVIAQSVKDSLTAYYPFSAVAYTPAEVQERIQSVKNEISYIIFDEDWQLDTTKFEMRKYVRSYTLMREYQHYNDTVKTPIATFSQQTLNVPFENLTLLARNVAYEVPLVNAKNPEWVENISHKRAAQLIIDKALAGEQAYKFMVSRDTLQPLSLAEVKELLGEETNYEILYDELDEATDTIAIQRPIDVNEFVSFAFIEDWYYDKATMRIYKDVKGIAPVRETEKMFEGEYETLRTIPFFMFFSNHKEKK